MSESQNSSNIFSHNILIFEVKSIEMVPTFGY